MVNEEEKLMLRFIVSVRDLFSSTAGASGARSVAGVTQARSTAAADGSRATADVTQARALSLLAGSLLIIACAAMIAGPVRYFYLIEIANRSSLVTRLLPFYPLFFLPLFTRRTFGRGGFFALAMTVFAAALILVGRYTGVQSAIWLGGVWLGFALARFFGLHVKLGGYALVLLAPPFIGKVELIAGFSLRLFFSQIAARLLSFLDPAAAAQGNVLSFRGDSFAVDPACEGLKMLTAAALAVMIVFSKYVGTDNDGQTSRRDYLFAVAFAFLALGLWLASNLARIIVLVFGNIGPDSPAHGLTGILLFLAVVIFPLLLLHALLQPFRVRSENSNHGAPDAPDATGARDARARTRGLLFAAGFAALVCVLSFAVPARPASALFAWPSRAGAFQLAELEPPPPQGTGRFSEMAVFKDGDRTLVLKQRLLPLRAGHHPRWCWEGLGYKFIKENDLTLPGRGVVRHSLVKRNVGNDSQEFQLLWWYQPASTLRANMLLPDRVFSSEIEWRKRTLLQGESFVQVNLILPVGSDVAKALAGFAGLVGRR